MQAKPVILLLTGILLGVVACDKSPAPMQEEKSLFYTAKPETVADMAAPTGDASTPIPASADFSPAKRGRLAALVAEHHYQKPTVQDILPHTTTASQLNRYLRTLDAYSRYLSTDENHFFQERAELKRTGIGINLLVHKNEILAVPAENSPAYLAGLTRPSRLLSLNGGGIDFDNFASYSFLTSLEPGDLTPIKVADPVTGEPRAYTITAGHYQRELAAYTEHGELGIITIYEFREETTSQVRKFLSQAMHEKALIIDLRYCPGGDLFAAVDMLSLFLPAKQDVVYLTAQGQNKPLDLQTLPGRLFKGKPIYLLTSKYTASSAEVFAHAVKKYLPASHILGEATTGKCLALEKHALEDGSALELSAYEILTPDKQSCNGLPIPPDTSIPGIETLDIRDAIHNLRQ